MSNTEKTKRCSNFTKEEERILTQLVHKNRNIIECKKSGQVTWEQKTNTWRTIADQFNSTVGGEFKGVQILKCKYANLKKSCKRKFATNKATIVKTGGGSGNLTEIDDVDSTIHDILGAQIDGLPSAFDSDADFANSLPGGSGLAVPSTHEKELPQNIQVIGDKYNLTESEDEIEAVNQQNNLDTINVLDNSTENWNGYSSKMLKNPPHKKLQTLRQNNKKSLAFKKNTNEKLLEAKLEFIRIQKECFEEEHKLKMEILQKKKLLLDKKLRNAEIKN